MRSVYFSFVVGAFLCFACMPNPGYTQVKGRLADTAPDYYRIQPGDKLSIKFFSNPELNELAVVVRPDGYISPQLIDELTAAGKTVAELKAQLEKAYNEILLTPMISVSVVEFVAPRIFIGGQINKPGRYDLREAKTLVQAVFLAGGFTRDARRSMVIHARPNGKGDWDIETSNVMKILDQRSTERDIQLQDGDYIFVPDSKISQLNKAVEAFRGLLPRFL